MKTNFTLLFLLLAFFEVKSQDKDTYFIYKDNDSVAQVDAIDYLVKLLKTKRYPQSIKNQKVSFSFFPTENKNDGERILVSSFNATFLLGDKKNTNVSTIYLIPYISSNNQYGIELYPTIWLQKNSWNFVGEYFVLNFPQYTYGLGGASLTSSQTLVDGKHIRFRQNILKGIFPNLAVGLGYQYDKHQDLEILEDDFFVSNPDFKKGEKYNSIASGISIPIVYDNRKNINNPQSGWYSSLNYQINSASLGSDNNCQSIFFDLRKYYPFANTRSVLALRSYYWSVISGEMPYFDLPATRSDPGLASSSRGLQKNRYRSNAMLFFESEYRFNISRNGFFGGVFFINTTSASEYKSQNFKYWQPAIGTGVRLKFNKYTKVNVAFDFGISKDYSTVYLKIGEVF